MLLYSSEPEKLRAVFRDVFGWENGDAHDGWLIFALPPAELGVHPSDGDTRHQLSFICDDVHATLAELRLRGIEAEDEPLDVGYGIATTLILPGGVRAQLYEPRHASPLAL